MKITGRTKYKTFSVSLTNTSTVVVGPNPNRVGLWVTGISGHTMTLGFGEAAAVRTGLGFETAEHPVLLHEGNIGDAIHQQITAVLAAAGPQSAGFMELVS